VGLGLAAIAAEVGLGCAALAVGSCEASLVATGCAALAVGSCEALLVATSLAWGAAELPELSALGLG
jgi:hypothetical protein